MPSRQAYLERLGANTMGGGIRRQANIIMEASWNRDVQSKPCFIYDYFHDSEHELNKGLSPFNDPLKTYIDAKYIVSQYPSIAKDQVEYHITFKPSQTNPLTYFEEYERKYKVEFPIGLYMDIPDEKGVYRRWMVCGKDYEQQFVKYSVLPCNYHFKWIKEYKKYEMWGVARMRNSYNAGVWTDYKFTTTENQDQMWLPMNDISNTIYYDDRFIISSLMREPLIWQVSKVENIHPFGINKITLSQTKFVPELDYVNMETGEMYADYYKNLVPLTEGVVSEDDEPDFELSVNSRTNNIKIGGGARKITATKHIRKIELWKFKIDGNEEVNGVAVKDLLGIEYGDNYVSVKFLGDEMYLKKLLTISYQTQSISLEIVSL